jgi:hypothetical protein
MTAARITALIIGRARTVADEPELAEASNE